MSSDALACEVRRRHPREGRQRRRQESDLLCRGALQDELSIPRIPTILGSLSGAILHADVQRLLTPCARVPRAILSETGAEQTRHALIIVDGDQKTPSVFEVPNDDLSAHAQLDLALNTMTLLPSPVLSTVPRLPRHHGGRDDGTRGSGFAGLLQRPPGVACPR